MTDYNVKIGVRNNRILRAIKESGSPNIKHFADKHRISYSALHALLAFRAPAIKTDGELTAPAIKMCKALNMMPADLFTDEQLELRIQRSAEIELSSEEVRALLPSAPDPLERIAHQEAAESVLELIDNPRMREIVERVVMGGETADSVGRDMGIAGARVQQLKQQALERIRDHSLSGNILWGALDA